jgi:uroporphyrinogen-III synthase
MSAQPLVGRTVVTTRDEPGRLDALLVAAGATVVHVPLIEIVDADDGGAALRIALDSLAEVDWLIVTSVHGARRVGAAAAQFPQLRLAAVGTRTARELAELAGRVVDVIPARSTAVDLCAAMPDPRVGERVLIAQANRAQSTLRDGLTDKGYDVTVVTAYVSNLRQPTVVEVDRAIAADAVAFASGSAATAWSQSIGTVTPKLVIVIGPSTAQVARSAGLKVTHVASDHSVEGLLSEVAAAFVNDF